MAGISRRQTTLACLLGACVIGLLVLQLDARAGSLPGTAAYEGDPSQETLAAKTLDGWRDYFLEETSRTPETRTEQWETDRPTPSILRDRLARRLGVTGDRVPIDGLSYTKTTATPALIDQTATFTIQRVRWPTFNGVEAEGLLLEPENPRAQIVLAPDADQAPELAAGLVDPKDGMEQTAVARRLAAAGCRVVVPALVNRDDTWSGSEELDRWTNQPHREWIYRQAFQAGRHIIGYETEMILAVVDWFAGKDNAPIGVFGYGEGGLLALHASALDERIEATLVSGYFGPREGLWEEPIYRNVWALLEDFGGAELAALIAPRALVIEYSEAPAVSGPPEPRPGRAGAAPGHIETPSFEAINAEFERARALAGESLAAPLQLVHADGKPTGPWSDEALTEALSALGLPGLMEDAPDPHTRTGAAADLDEAARQRRLVRQLEAHTQRLIRESETERGRYFWKPLEDKASGHDAQAVREQWHAWTERYREALWEDILGRLPSPEAPFDLETRLIEENSDWTAHLVVHNVLDNVIGWGYLLVPTDIGEDERRPAVVCQHGLGGAPSVTIDPENETYGAYAARLAAKGYVVYAPYNLNAFVGGVRFRQIQRAANPLGLSIYSAIIAQHDATLAWLGALPFVDASRIGFYGLSYGGKTAMRAGALLEGYAVVICSGDFNEWVRKVTSVDAWHAPPASAPSNRFSGYPFTAEYEIFEFNLAHTFNYGEMAALIAPRPFMVERGHHDRVASDEWVAFEYAKARRLYNTVLQLPEHTTIAYFDGGHRIDGEAAFAFLDLHLGREGRESNER